MARNQGIVIVNFDAGLFKRDVLRFAKKQVPYAIATALNATILDTKEQLIEDLPKTFTIRSDWTEKGIRVRLAKKTKLGASVGTVDEYMRRQAVGDTKKPKDARMLGVPVKARANPKTKITPALWPGPIQRKQKGFYRETKSGGKMLLVPRRPRKPKKGRARRKRRANASKGKLLLMYILKSSIYVPKRWPLEKTLHIVATKRWVPNMAKAWKRALASKKR